MTTQIPLVGDLQARLSAMRYAEVMHLSEVSGVPLTTLWKIRTGETPNPGIETVRKFWPFLRRMKAKK